MKKWVCGACRNNYEERWYPESSRIYSSWAAQNLALLMQSTATMVMCAVPANCEGGESVVLCIFDKRPADGEAPFR